MQITESQSPRAENCLPDFIQMIWFQTLPVEHWEAISSEMGNSSTDEDSYLSKSDLAKCSLIISSPSLRKTTSLLPIQRRGLKYLNSFYFLVSLFFLGTDMSTRNIPLNSTERETLGYVRVNRVGRKNVCLKSD